jgi:hypothetical protein
MVRTTVYLDEADLAAIRRMAAETGRSQAALIREAVAEKARGASPRRLTFIAAGQGPKAAVGRHADEIIREELGRSPH